MAKTGRNELCPCGSGKKYKKCCEQRDERQGSQRLQERQAHQAALFKKMGEWMLETDELDNLSNGVVALIKDGRLDEADEACEQLLREYPEVVDGLMRKAQVHEARRMWREAAAYYRKTAQFAREHDGFEEEGIMAWLSTADDLEKRTANPDGAEPPYESTASA